MSRNLSSLIDDFETKSEEPKAGRNNNLSSLIDNFEQDKTAQLKANVFASAPISPDQAAKQWQISRQTKIPVDVVRTQENQIKQMTEINSINYDDLVNNFPKVAAQLADPSKTAAIRDDVENLGYFEKVFGSVKQEYKASKENVELADTLLKQMAFDVSGNEKFKLTPLEENNLGLIEQSQGKNKDYKLGFFSMIPAYTAAAIPTILNTIPQTLGGAALGAGAGYAIGGPVGVGVGATYGARAGTVYGAGKLEAGLAYQELKGLVDETGKPIEKQVAAGGAIATGLVNGLLELVPFEATTAPIKKAFSREGVKQLAKTSAGREYLKNIGSLALAEGVAEGFQELSSVVFKEAAKAASTGDYNLVGMKDANDTEGFIKFLSESAGRIAESAKAGFGAGLGLGAATGSITYARQAYDQREQGKKEKEQITETVDKIKESKTFQRDPELFKEVTKDTLGEQNIYMPAKQVKTFFQSKTPEELEKFYNAVPEAREQIDEAIETGGNLVLPANSALTAVAQNPEFAELQNFMSYSPESLSEEGAQDAFLNDVAANVNFEEQTKKKNTEEDIVRENIKNQILNLGMPYRDAKDLISTVTSYYDTKLSRYGSEEAKKILDTYLGNLKIENKQNPESESGFFQDINQLKIDFKKSTEEDIIKAIEKLPKKYDQSIIFNKLTAATPSQKLKYLNKKLEQENANVDEFLKDRISKDEFDKLLLDQITDYSNLSRKDKDKIISALVKANNVNLEIFLKESKDFKVNKRYFQTAKDQTKTEAFKKWFGDSKVVDEKGEPLVVYHGTNRTDFEEFSANGNFGFEPAIYFSSSKKLAKQYLGYKGEGKIFETYLSIKDPYIIEAEGASFNDLYNQLLSQISSAKSDGKDGLIIKNIDDSRLQNKKSKHVSDIYVVFDSKQIKSVKNKGTFDSNNPNILYQDQKNPLGQTQFIGQKPIISLFEGKNRSTLLHELGHIFLQIENDISKLPDVSEQIGKDWKTLEKWLDIKDGKITVEAHEKFARGFEAYLREGKAPSIALRDAFRKFKAWLLRIYQDVIQLDVKLTNEVREVFDRMLATDEAIESLRDNPIFRTDDKVMELLTAKEREDYQKLTENAGEKAKEKLLTKALKQKEVENKKLYKAERKRVRKEIEDEMNKSPVFRVIHFLKTGKLLGEETPEGTEAYKLSRTDIKKNYDGEIIKYLPNDILANEGAAVDFVADEFGFKDGGEMLNAIANAPNFKKELKRATDDEMVRRYGDMLFDGTIEEEALNASENEARANKIVYELNAANRKVRTYIETKESYKQKAKEIIGNKQIKDATQSNIFYLNEIRAAREAGKALGKKDYEAAVKHKKEQLLNHYLFRESLELKKDVQSALKRYARYKKKPSVGKVVFDEDYREKIVNLLQDFGLAAKTEDYQKTNITDLEAWKKEQAENGVLGLVEFPEIAEFQNKDNIRVLTTDEFRTLDDAISNLAHIAYGLRTLEIDGKKIEINKIADEIKATIEDNLKEREVVRGNLTPKQKAEANFESFMMPIIKAKEIALMLDGEEALGTFYNYFIKPVSDGEINRNKMMEDVWHKLEELYKKHFGTKAGEISGKKVFIPAVNFSYSKQDMIAFALNWGNETNRKRIRDGFNYSDAQVNAILSNLTKNEWDFVQDMWSLIGSFFNDVANLQRKLVGFKPKQVKPISFKIKTADGQEVELKGGYYPISYSNKLTNNTSDQDLNAVFGSVNSSINFEKSYTKGRTEKKVNKEIDLSLKPAFKHLSDVLSDLALKEQAWNSYKILNNYKVKEAIGSHAGKEAFKQLDIWLKDLFGDANLSYDAFSGLINNLRAGTTISTMGFKLSTALMQPSGFTQSIVKIGYKDMLIGLMKALGNGNPMQINKNFHLVMEKSKIMKDRAKTYHKDIYDTLKKMERKSTIAEKASKIYFWPMAKMQMMVDVPTWLGAYNQGLRKFKGDDKKAIDYADLMVVQSQGSGLESDLSAFERGSAFGQRKSLLVKIFTAFYTYFNAKLNLAYGSYRRTNFKKPRDIARFASDFLLLFWAETLIGNFLTNRIPDFDDDDEGKFLAYNIQLILETFFSQFPIAREAVSAAKGFDVAPSGISGLKKVVVGPISAGKELTKLYSDDEEFDITKVIEGLNDAGGIVFKYPSSQIDVFIDAIQEAEKGEDVAPIDYVIRKPK